MAIIERRLHSDDLEIFLMLYLAPDGWFYDVTHLHMVSVAYCPLRHGLDRGHRAATECDNE